MDKQYSPDRPFDLKGDSADFRSKKSDVFGSLDDIEKSYQTNLAGRLEEEVERNPGGSRDEVATSFDDGGFKRPGRPAVRCSDRLIHGDENSERKLGQGGMISSGRTKHQTSRKILPNGRGTPWKRRHSVAMPRIPG